MVSHIHEYSNAEDEEGQNNYTIDFIITAAPYKHKI